MKGIVVPLADLLAVKGEAFVLGMASHFSRKAVVIPIMLSSILSKLA